MLAEKGFVVNSIKTFNNQWLAIAFKSLLRGIQKMLSLPSVYFSLYSL